MVVGLKMSESLTNRNRNYNFGMRKLEFNFSDRPTEQRASFLWMATRWGD